MKRIWILALVLLIGCCPPPPEKTPEMKKITCKYGNPDCDQWNHKPGNENHICLAVHDPCWPLEVTTTQSDSCKHGSYISMGDGIGTCLECGKGLVYDKGVWGRPLEIIRPKKLEEQ